MPYDNAAASVAISALLFVAAFVVAVARVRRLEHDVILSSLLVVPMLGSLTRRAPMTTGATMWVVLSVSVAVFAGQTKPADFLTIHGLLSIVNFSLILPLAAGVYFRFRINAAAFLDSSTQSALGLRSTSEIGQNSRLWWFVREPVLILLALAVQVAIIASEIEFGLPETIWIERVADHNVLNRYGALHFAIRGIFVYFGFSVFVYGLGVFYRLAHLSLDNDPQLYTSGYRVHWRVRALGATFLLAALMGSVAVAVQGAVLFIVISRASASPVIVLLKSTWTLWVAITITGTMVIAGMIQRLQELLREARDQIETREFATLNRWLGPGEDNPSLGKQAVDYEKFFQARAQLRRIIEGIETSPLPGGTRGFVGAVILQVAGILTGVAGLLRSR